MIRIKYLPKKDENEISVEVCDHRFGAEMTFSHQTDSRLLSSIYAAELYGFKNNVRLGAFISNVVNQNNSGIEGVESTGLMKHDIYFGTDVWKNPVTENVERIPDYYSTVWTESGASFFNVTEGESKVTRFPNHGQQMFDLSGGVYGYDFGSNLSGESNIEELSGVYEKQQELIDLLGKNSSSGSYRNGVRNAVDLMPLYFLGVRNSAENHSGNSDTFYGSGLGNNTSGVQDVRQFFKSYPSSTRWWDSFTHAGEERAYMDSYLKTEIEKTIVNKGWYRDFCHWHSMRSISSLLDLDEFLQLVNEAFGDSFVWTCSNGEALEYMFLREITEAVVAKRMSNGSVLVLIDVVDKWKGFVDLNGVKNDLDLSKLNVPLSVRVDLSGTELSGKSVKSDFGKIRSLGNDVYIVEVPFDFKEDFKSVYLSEGMGFVYNESIPQAEISRSLNVLTLVSEMECKSVLFKGVSGVEDYDFEPVERVSEFKREHFFELEDGFDYKVGLISEFGKSNLISI